MRYLSVCSGIEAATVAWHPLRWSPVAFAEIERFPSAVLAHHYPHVPNLGDMTKFKDWPDATPDVLVGGTPCQSFSVAGLRKGMADPRGNLALTYLAIADRYRPEWLLWENVPGVLSSSEGRDFGAFLGGLAELGYGFAYRVLDAQYVRTLGFGRAVPQRRRRVFVVGNSRDWRRAAAVLFERESLSWDSPPSREAGQGVAAAVAPSLTASGRGVERTGDTRGQDPVVAIDLRNATLDPVSMSIQAGGMGTDRGICPNAIPHTFAYAPSIARCVATREGSSQDYESTTMVAVHAIQAGALRTNPNSGPDGVGVQADIAYTLEARAEVQAVSVTGQISHALKAEGADASEDGTGRGTPIIAFQSKASAHQSMNPSTIAPTLDKGKSDGVAVLSVALRGRDGGATAELGGDVATALRASSDGGDKPHVLTSAVRRLTPRECERLQGFPDGYTDVPWRNKNWTPDGLRYKALGNSMAVNVMRWLGRRIQMVQEIGASQ